MKIKARKWLDEWEHLINVANFEGARALFADDVVSFGTYAEVLHGLDQLEELQWRKVWPNIANFSFEEPSILVREGGIATIVVLWHSRGRTSDGGWYERRGRATLILEDGKNGLRCIHSHLSMEPGIPPLASG